MDSEAKLVSYIPRETIESTGLATSQYQTIFIVIVLLEATTISTLQPYVTVYMYKRTA